jgi:hypothetical protein
MEKSWKNSMKYEVLIVKEERNILQSVKNKEGRSTALVISCLRTFVLKHIIEGKIEGRSDGTTRKKT